MREGSEASHCVDRKKRQKNMKLFTDGFPSEMQGQHVKADNRNQ